MDSECQKYRKILDDVLASISGITVICIYVLPGSRSAASG